MLGKNKMSMCFYELDKDIPKKLSMNKSFNTYKSKTDELTIFSMVSNKNLFNFRPFDKK